VDLVDTASAGFHHITGLEIDQRRGDLWVVSINDGLDGNAPASVLHKLQLISGRPLKSFVLPASFGFARFEDVAVTRAGTVYVLDSIGGRLFSLSARGRQLARRINLVVDRPSSLAAVDERTVYIAHAEGISRLDVVTGRTTKVRAAEGTSLEGLERIRWYRGRLTGSQRLADGRQQAVVIRLAGAGHAGASLAVVGADGDLADPGAATMADGVLYFVTREVDSAGGSVLVVRGARLR
jgi:hypothetical protein